MSTVATRPRPVPGPVHPERPPRRGLPGGRLSRLVALLLLAAGLSAFTGAGPAAAASYKGKTKGGTAITFNLAGSKLKNIRTMVPTICVETTGGYSSRAGAELFQPRKATLGRKVKSKALQPSAMNHATKVTKNYTVEAHRSGRRIKGKLSLNFSFVILDLYGARILMCNGTTAFTAAPR